MIDFIQDEKIDRIEEKIDRIDQVGEIDIVEEDIPTFKYKEFVFGTK